MKADLQVYGAVGFQEYFMKKQEYLGKNPLKLLVDACFSKNIDLCAIVSEEHNIEKDSVNDRFGYLLKRADELRELNLSYKNKFEEIRYRVDDLNGEPIDGTYEGNIAIASRENKKVLLINAQNVIINDTAMCPPSDCNFESRLLIIGSNQVPNGKNFNETMSYARKNGLISVMPLPYFVTDFLLIDRVAYKVSGDIMPGAVYWDVDAIVGDNPQMKIPGFFANFSKVLRKVSKRNNKIAKKISMFYNLPWISVSYAHRFEDIGISYIELDDRLFDAKDEISLISGLKEMISKGQFLSHEGEMKFGDWFDWTVKLHKGVFRDYIKAHLGKPFGKK